MKTRIGARRWATALLALPLLAIIAAVAPGSASAEPDGDGGHRDQRDHWGVIARNTIGSPVADLRNGPFTRFNATGTLVRPPYGQGSLGIEVADDATTLGTSSEKVDFGNEVDFFGKPVSELTRVGFHVFQTGENVSYGGTTVNMPNIRFEINPNLGANPTTTYSTLVWVPAESPTLNGWSPFLDATQTGTWFLTGPAGAAIDCEQGDLCSFSTVQTRLLADGGAPATIYTAAVGKGRDFIWVGAVDGLRINDTIYDFEQSGVKTIRPRPGA
ncbi:hypothetical protein [Catellatospora sichuanensis]|uniref:hypothetical protein n=1 Tax=Catellatospora sichuanensis TaxID=1969805 RepID=UPI001C925AD9|nr:hypothetical protein [Catellatospora sichuanensis]